MSRPRDAESDRALIAAARNVIRRNFDAVGFKHTVGAAVLCGSGEIYTGVDVCGLHGACAEVIAIGTAITAGEREFVAIVCTRGADGEEMLPPCGNCRQLLNDYSPECEVFVASGPGVVKIMARDLLPHAYRVE